MRPAFLFAAVLTCSGAMGAGRPTEPQRLDREPRRIHHVEPVYPSGELARGEEGDVWFECEVGPDGRVLGVRQVQYSGKTDAFLDPARAAVQQWRYAPDTRGHTRVFTVHVRYRIPDKPIRQRSVQDLILDLSAGGQEDSRAAWRELDDRGAGVVPDLLAALDQADDRQAVRVLSLIGSFGSEAHAALPVIMSLVGPPRPRSSDLGEREAAALSAAARIDRTLAGGLGRQAVRVRDVSLCRALAAELGPSGLIDALALPGCREAALDALTPCHDPRVLEHALAVVRDADASVRRGAWEVIEDIGESSERRHWTRHQERLHTALLEALSDADAEVRAAAVRAAGSLAAPNQKRLRAAVVAAFSDVDARVRSAAIQTARKLDPSIDMLPALVAILNDPNLTVRSEAAAAIAQLGPAARPVGPLIQSALEALPSGPAQYSVDARAARAANEIELARRSLEDALKTIGFDRSEAQLQQEEAIYTACLVKALARDGRGASRNRYRISVAGRPASRELVKGWRRIGLPVAASSRGDGLCALSAVEWIAGDLVRVSADFSYGGFSHGSGVVYSVAKRDGEWSVVALIGGWIE
jgi:TonB family protein